MCECEDSGGVAHPVYTASGVWLLKIAYPSGATDYVLTYTPASTPALRCQAANLIPTTHLGHSEDHQFTDLTMHVFIDGRDLCRFVNSDAACPN